MRAGAAKHLAEVQAMLGVLGLDPLAAPWSAGGGRGDLRPVRRRPGRGGA